MLKEFESVFEVLMKEEFEILRPMLKLRLQAVQFNER
jgi:hypothetical protein